MKQANLFVVLMLCVIAIAGMSGLAAAETPVVNETSQREQLNAIMVMFLPPPELPLGQSPSVAYAGGKIINAGKKYAYLGNPEKVAVVGFLVINQGSGSISINQIGVLESSSTGVVLSAPHLLINRNPAGKSTYWMANSEFPLSSVVNFNPQQIIAGGQTADIEVLVGISGAVSGNIRIDLDSIRWSSAPGSKFTPVRTTIYDVRGEVLAFS